jgi:DedD protein
MRGVFDDERLERGRSQRDTELTLGSGTLFAMFLGLVLLCGLCFGVGYALGHRSLGTTAAAAQPQPAPDQEPLQGNGGLAKPSAISETPDAPAQPPATDQAAQPAAPETSAPVQPAAAPAQPVQPQVHAALASSEVQQAPSTIAAPQAPVVQQQLMVQIAAVSNPDDAEVLMNALHKRNYPVTARRDPSDNLIHVRIGPFATRQIADQWRNKLLSDGYNAVVQ